MCAGPQRYRETMIWKWCLRIAAMAVSFLLLCLLPIKGYTMEWSLPLGKHKSHFTLYYGAQLQDDYLFIMHNDRGNAHGVLVSKNGKLLRDDLDFYLVGRQSRMGDKSFLLAGKYYGKPRASQRLAVLYDFSLNEYAVVNGDDNTPEMKKKFRCSMGNCAAFICPANNGKALYVLQYNRFERDRPNVSEHIIAFDETGKTLWRWPLASLTGRKATVRQLEQQGNSIQAYIDIDWDSPQPPPPRLVRFSLDGGILQQLDIQLPRHHTSVNGREFLVINDTEVVFPREDKKGSEQLFYFLDTKNRTMELKKRLPLFDGGRAFKRIQRLKSGEYVLFLLLRGLVILDKDFNPIEYCPARNSMDFIFADKDDAFLTYSLWFDQEGYLIPHIVKFSRSDFLPVPDDVFEDRVK